RGYPGSRISLRRTFLRWPATRIPAGEWPVDERDQAQPTLALAQALPALVDGDAHEPSLQRRIAPECADDPIRLDIRFLYGVFGVVVVTQDAARRAVKRLVAAPHQVLQRLAVAARNAVG